MGFGNYSHDAHRAITNQRSGLAREQIFKQTRCHPLMDPHGVRVRESRDGPAHPKSIGVVFTLFLLFMRWLPMVAMTEVKGTMPQADPHLKEHAEPAAAGALAAEGAE